MDTREDQEAAFHRTAALRPLDILAKHSTEPMQRQASRQKHRQWKSNHAVPTSATERCGRDKHILPQDAKTISSGES